MKRVIALSTLFILGLASCDIVKQNNLFEIINKKPEFLVSVTSVNDGARDVDYTASVSPERQVNGQTVTLTASPGPRSRFIRWERTSGVGDIGNETAEITSFTIRASNATVAAHFGPALHGLTLFPATSRGTMRLDGVAFSGTSYLEDGTTHSIEAVPATNPTPYYFTQWAYSGEGVAIDNIASNSTTITLTAGNATISPRFSAQTTQLTISAVGSGSGVPGHTIPSGMVTAGVGWAEEDNYIVRAVPDAGARFLGWELVSGNAAFANPSNPNTTVICYYTDPVSIRARFALNTYTLSLASDTGGAVAPSPEPAGWPLVEHGQVVGIRATANSGYVFTGWTADPAANAVFGNANAASTTVALSGNATVRAHFVATPLAEVARSSQLSGEAYVQSAVTLFERRNAAGALLGTDVVIASSDIDGTAGSARFFSAADLSASATIGFNGNGTNRLIGMQPMVIYESNGASHVCVPSEADGDRAGFFFIYYDDYTNSGYKGGGYGLFDGPMAAFADYEYLAHQDPDGSIVERYPLDDPEYVDYTGWTATSEFSGGIAIDRRGFVYTRGFDGTHGIWVIYAYPYNNLEDEPAIFDVSNYGGARSYLSFDTENRLVFVSGDNHIIRATSDMQGYEFYYPISGSATNRDVIISHSRYFVTCDDGSLFSVSDTETTPWSRTDIVATTSPVVSRNGTLYVGCADGRVRAYNHANGALLFTSDALGGPITSELLLDEDGYLYAATEGGVVVKFRGDGSGLEPGAPWPMTGGNSRRTRCAADPKYGKAPLKTLHFVPNGGTGSAMHTGLEGTRTSHAGLGFNRTGYTFMGWNTEADGSGDAYGPYQEYTFREEDDQYLYAMWE
jgi:uncharacterized repeat protein (TIGR02543 family)